MILGEYNYSKGSDKKVKVRCDNCGKIFEKPYRNAIRSKQHSCCKECNTKLKQEKALKEFEDKIGEEAYAYLKREYIDNKRTTRQISKDIYGTENNCSNIASWIKKLGIELRHGSEAIKTQWINNDERRKQASKTMKETRKITDKSFINRPEYRQHQSESKKGKKNPMYGRRGELVSNGIQIEVMNKELRKEKLLNMLNGENLYLIKMIILANVVATTEEVI